MANFILFTLIFSLKHEQELDSKSTAIHSKLLAPEQISIHQFHRTTVTGSESVSSCRELVDDISTNPSAYVILFPDECAVELKDLPADEFNLIRNVIVIDGTWSQAAAINRTDPYCKLRRIKISPHLKTVFWRYQDLGEHCLSTIEAIRHVERAKEDGLPVTAEASPHHLKLDEECMRDYDTSYKMAPPLRTEADVEALQRAVAKGIVDVIATDHAPHGVTDKALEFDQAANGIIGLQTAVPITLELVHRKIVSPLRWVESLTLAPAKLLNVDFGTLRVGAIADVTVMNPNAKWTFEPSVVLSKSHNSPWIGHTLQGKIVATIVGGQIKHLA